MKYCALFAALLLLGACDSKEAGKAVGQGLHDFASGVGVGVDENLEVDCEVGPKMKELGLDVSVAKQRSITGTGGKVVEVYVLSSKECFATLTMIAKDNEGREVGRSKVVEAFEEDGGKYVEMEFDARIDMNTVAGYVLDVVKPMSADEFRAAKEKEKEETEKQNKKAGDSDATEDDVVEA